MFQSKTSPWLTLKGKTKAGQLGQGSASSLVVCLQKVCSMGVSLLDKWKDNFSKGNSFLVKVSQCSFHLDIFYGNSLTPWEALQCQHKCPPQTAQWQLFDETLMGMFFTCQSKEFPRFENQIMAMIGIHFRSSILLLLILKLYVESRLPWCAPAYWSYESLTGLPWLPKITNVASYWPYSYCKKNHLPFLTKFPSLPWADDILLEAGAVSG